MVNMVIFQEDTMLIDFIKFAKTAEIKCLQQPISNTSILQNALFISKSVTEEKSILTFVN
jgi:hypothetical protein